MAGALACDSGNDASPAVTDASLAPEVVESTDPPPATTRLTDESVDAADVPPTTEVVEATDPEPVAAPPTTAPARADALELGLISCERFGFFARVDPEVASTYVPDRYELSIVDGDARFALQTMSCDDLVTDGVSHGAGHFGTVWMRIIGPEDAVTLPPESELVAQPADSFNAPLFHTDNESFHAATTAFGIPMTLAESMTSDPPTEGTQTGEVTDLDYRPPFSYRWSVDNVNWRDASPVGVHNLFGLDDEGAPLTYYGEFLHEPGWSGNSGTVELEPGSAFEDLLGPSIVGPANGDPVTVDMIVFRDAS